MAHSEAPLFGARTLAVRLFAADPRVVDAAKMSLEQHLKKVGSISLSVGSNLDAEDLSPYNLVIIAAQSVPREKFTQWFSNIVKRFQRTDRIWAPALIMADVSFVELRAIWEEVKDENWYFDILSPSHMESLPIRMANLLRMTDHLRELHRYEESLADLQAQVLNLEKSLQILGKTSS